MSAQPSHLLIHPGILKGRISAPPSKSISHRLLIMGALSGENCTINNILMSEDIEITLNALAGMGFQWILNKNQVNFTGNRIVPEKEVRIFLGNSGTTARLLAAIAAAIPGKYHFSGTKRLQERPMQPLLKALENLGADIRHNRGFLPLQVSGKQLNGGKIEIDASVSSQFISGLMMMAPLMQRGLEILPINSAVSVPYIKLTINLMKQAGITVQEQDPLIIIPGQQKFELGKCRVEGDYSSASYFAVGAAISGGDVLIENLNRHSVQGDRKILSILAEAGADISWQNSAVRISARRLNGIDTDMKDVPDIVPSAAVMALFAEGPSRLREVEHLRYKETDRLQALVENIERLGGIARIEGTNLSIVPAPLKGTCLPTFNDHRMAMSFALVGLRIPEVYIENPGCVVKSFPEFWSGLDRLREPAL